MAICIYIVLFMLAFTKLLDVVSTLARLQHPLQESNPFVRKCMVRFGVRTTVWSVYILCLAIIGVVGIIAAAYGAMGQAAVVAAGSAISVVQAAVAHRNWTGRDNGVTRRVRPVYSYLAGWLTT